MASQNGVTESGKVKVIGEDIRLRVTGDYVAIADIGEQLVRGANGHMVRVKDVATITRGYLDPPLQLLKRDGQAAVGLGISTVSGGNVVTMGNAVQQEADELTPRIPVGIDIHTISFQAGTVKNPLTDFSST